jgi:D-alanyl-D-alanine carboxypeptidase
LLEPAGVRLKNALALATLLGSCVAVPASARPDGAAADTAVRAYIAREGIPTAHVTIIRGDEVILQRGFSLAGTVGPTPDAASVFPLGSISKQFTAATILALVDAGKVRLDARVGEYLPEWFADEPALHVSHLLAQTSGLADHLWLEGYRPLADDPATPIAAYVALAAETPRRFAPGTRWAYSNTNYKALALIVERVTGRSFDDVLADLVLRPAGLDGISACHSLRPDQFVPGVSAEGRHTPLDASAAAYVGDGGLCGNAAALVKWIRFGLMPGNSRISRLALPSRLADGTQVPYGFGLSTRGFLGHSMVWHGGNVDSHSSMIAYLPDEDIGLVILTSKGFVWLTELMPTLLGDAPPARAGASGPPPSGRFDDSLFRYAITPDGDTLRVEIDLIGPLNFVPAGPREYVAEKYPATFRIRLPADGSRDRFELDWGEVRSYARRVRD